MFPNLRLLPDPTWHKSISCMVYTQARFFENQPEASGDPVVQVEIRPGGQQWKVNSWIEAPLISNTFYMSSLYFPSAVSL